MIEERETRGTRGVSIGSREHVIMNRIVAFSEQIVFIQHLHYKQGASLGLYILTDARAFKIGNDADMSAMMEEGRLGGWMPYN